MSEKKKKAPEVPDEGKLGGPYIVTEDVGEGKEKVSNTIFLSADIFLCLALMRTRGMTAKMYRKKDGVLLAMKKGMVGDDDAGS